MRGFGLDNDNSLTATRVGLLEDERTRRATQTQEEHFVRQAAVAQIDRGIEAHFDVLKAMGEALISPKIGGDILNMVTGLLGGGPVKILGNLLGGLFGGGKGRGGGK